MNQVDATTPSGPINFDVLRARLEGDIPRPGLILITSATTDDGSDIAARNLAASFAAINYRTLLVDTLPGPLSRHSSAHGTKLDDAPRALDSLGKAGTCVEIALNKHEKQATSGATLNTAVKSLRTSFDYLVIQADYTIATSFTTLAIGVADAIYVAVRASRRETKNDRHLAALNRAGRRFCGVLSMPPASLEAGLVRPTVPSVKADYVTTPSDAPLRARI